MPAGASTSNTPWRIFLSHTSELDRLPTGRTSYVQCAIDTVLTAEHQPVDMRHFPNRDLTPSEIDRDRLESCHVYFGIFGFRWGSECASRPGFSYTETEYDLAGELGIPRRIFLLDDRSTQLGASPVELGFSEASFAQQTTFRHRVKERVVNWVTSPEDLKASIAQALIDLRISGDVGVPGAQPRQPSRSTVPSRRERPFIGRAQQLATLDELLGDPTQERVVLVHGHPGVGKSELAFEYARLHPDRYPGGRFFIRWGSGAGLVDLAKVGAKLGLELSGVELAEQCELTMNALSTTPTLLLYDNPTHAAEIDDWLPASDVPCHVLVTSTNERLLASTVSIAVAPLSNDESRCLVRSVAGEEVSPAHEDQLVGWAGGLPAQLLPSSEALAYEMGRGRSGGFAAALSPTARSSYELAYSSLDITSRLLLHAMSLLSIDRIERIELSGQLIDAFGWSDADVSHAIDVCVDRHLIEGVEQLRMHQLLAAHLRSLAIDDSSTTDSIGLIRSAQWRRLVVAARLTDELPTDRDRVARLLTYPLHVTAWAEMKGEIEDPGRPAHIVGDALFELGDYTQARPWYERAVTEAELGDIHGRINHESLGASIHEVGNCWYQLGDYTQARPWFERAVTEKSSATSTAASTMKASGPASM